MYIYSGNSFPGRNGDNFNLRNYPATRTYCIIIYIENHLHNYQLSKSSPPRSVGLRGVEFVKLKFKI